MTVAPVPVPVPIPGPGKMSLLARSAALQRIWYHSDIVRLSIICVLGGSLGFYHISYLSLWNDEAFSRFYYQASLHFMWTEGLHSESSPPLYYMALRAWIDCFGSSEAALRSLSAVASIIAIVLVYRLGSWLFDGRHGLLAAALFALSATEIYYAQEARCYALLLIPVLAMLLACTDYIRGLDRYASLAAYIVAATVGIYTHTTMFFFVAACGLSVFAYAMAVHGSLWDRRVRDWIGVHLCVGTLVLPAVIGMLDAQQTQQLNWIPAVSLHQMGAIFSNTVAGTPTPGQFPGVVLAIAAAGVMTISIWRDMPPWRTMVIAVAIPSVYTALLILASLAVPPILLSRVFCRAGVPLYLIEAHAVMARGWLRPIAIGAILGTTVVGLYYQLSIHPNAKEPWRESIQFAATELQQADLIVLAPGTDPATFTYYAPKVRNVAMWWSEVLAPSEVGITPRILNVPGTTHEQIARRIKNPSSRVVLIAKDPDKATLKELSSVARPPDQRTDFRCRGGDSEPTTDPCGIAILAWRPPLVGTEQNVRPGGISTYNAVQ
jgi:mannosyltransferase